MYTTSQLKLVTPQLTERVRRDRSVFINDVTNEIKLCVCYRERTRHGRFLFLASGVWYLPFFLLGVTGVSEYTHL
jgi:hypothetical protein